GTAPMATVTSFGSDLRVLAVSSATDWGELASSLAGDGRITVLTSDEPLPVASRVALEQADLTLAPGGPDRLTVASDAGDVDLILEANERFPGATSTLAAVLRLGDRLDVAGGITTEAHAYSALLAGPEHKRWLRARTPRLRRADGNAVTVERVA